MEKQKCIIIGSGPAGLTAAIYAARAEMAPLVFEGAEPGGQLMGTTVVENWPANMANKTGPMLMNEMREQAQKFGAKTEFKKIDSVDFSDSENLKLFSGQEEYTSETVIIATGASARWLELGKGEEKFHGKGYSACATCDGAFFRDKVVCVVGGGDSAAEEATFLTKFAKKVYLIYRGPQEKMRASAPMQKRVFANEKIEFIPNKNVTNLLGEMKLEAVELTDSVTGEVSKLEVDGCFVAVGHTPNTKFLNGILKADAKGFLKVTNFTRTSIPSVFVAGDVSDPRYQQAVTAAGAGCMAALDAEKFLVEKE